MRRIVITTMAVIALLLGVTAPAPAAPARPSCPTSIVLTQDEEILNTYGTDDRNGVWEVAYHKSVVQQAGCAHAGQFLVHVDAGFYSTDLPHLANAIWLDLETSNNTWTAVAHYGGTDETEDDVSTQVTMPDKGDFWVTPGNGPAWRFNDWGVCAGTCHHFEVAYGAV